MEKRKRLELLLGLVLGIVVILVIGELFLIRYHTATIDYTLRDGEYLSRSWSGYMVGFRVSITSTGDYMNVRIIVDGIPVYSVDYVYTVSYEYRMSFGQHTVELIIENPPWILGLGPPIMVTGQITIQRW